MPMQDTINEIYRMQPKADDRGRQELEDKIKQCDLNLFAISKDKSELDEEFRTDYPQRGIMPRIKLNIMLRKYREKYGKKAEEQLLNQLDEARKDYVKQYETEGLLKSQNDPIDPISELMDIKHHILDELYKFSAVELLGVLLELLKTQNKDLN